MHAFTRNFAGEVHSSVGTAIGIGVGVSVAAIVATILVARHRAGASNGILFDAGWQFDLVLQNSLTLNTASVAATSSGA